MEILGIDIGGSGIKGAPVDVGTGALLAPRHRIPTPKSGKPRPMAKTVGEIAAHFEWRGPVGCGFPAVVQGGTARTAANVHKSWIGTDVRALFEKAIGCPIQATNDADAAGLAEMAFGAGRGRDGVVLLVTIGTGLGTALFADGQLVPNMELGHIELKGRDAEKWVSNAARKRKKLKWKKWSKRLDDYLGTMERLVWPDLIILGGGVIKKQHKFIPRLTLRTEVVPAQMRNEAGIIGAALAARTLVQQGEG